jgi:hypothetical protein
MVKITVDQTVGASALSQFALCKTNGALVVTAADTDLAIGVIQTDAAATEANVPMVTFGETKAIASGIIGRLVRICPDAAGKIKAAAAGDLVCGYTLEGAGADGDVIDIFFMPTTSVVIT